MKRNEFGRIEVLGHSWLGWLNILVMRPIGLVLVEERDTDLCHVRWVVMRKRVFDAATVL